MNGCTAWFRSRILIQRSAASSLQEAQALGMWTDLPRSAHPTLTWQTAGAFQPAVICSPRCSFGGPRALVDTDGRRHPGP